MIIFHDFIRSLVNTIKADETVVYAALGDNVTMRCRFLENATEGTKRWRIRIDVIVASGDRKVHQNYGRFKIKHDVEGKVFDLLIINLMEIDIGTYICDMQTNFEIQEQYVILKSRVYTCVKWIFFCFFCNIILCRAKVLIFSDCYLK